MPTAISFESKEEVSIKEPKSRTVLSHFLAIASDAILFVLIFLFPLFYLPGLEDPLGLPKQILLLSLVTVAGILWLVRVFLSRSLVLRKSFFFLPMILYVAVLGIATLTSIDRYTSLFGGLSNEYASFATLVGFILFVFFAVTSLHDLHLVRRGLVAFFFSNIVIVVLTLLKLFNVSIPFLPAGSTWNTIGSIFSLGVFSTISLILSCGLMLFDRSNHPIFLSGFSGKILKMVAGVTGVLNLFLLVVLDWWLLWLLIIVGVGLLLVFVFIYAQNFKNLQHLILALISFVFAILFLLIRTPINLNIPVEVAPGHGMSLEIAQKTLREFPALGSGPATYGFDYLKYKTNAFSNTLLWNFKFDRASSFVLTLLPTIGLAGSLIWLLMIVMLIGLSIKSFLKERDASSWLLNVVIFLPWVTILLAKFFYNSNMPLEFLFWVLTAFLLIIVSRKLSIFTFSGSPRTLLGASFGAVIFVVLMLILLMLGVSRTAGWYAYAKATEANAGGDFEKTRAELIRASEHDPRTDTFARNMAQVRISEAQKAGSVSDLQSFLNAAVIAAKYAIDLSPKNSLNWSMLGSVYSQMSGVVTGAGELGLQAFEKAREFEPRNSIYPTEEGKIEITLADRARRDASSKDEAVKRNADEQFNEHLNNAERLFQEAIELKNDYAPAHFYLAVVYERRGKLNDAVTKMEAVARYNPRDVGVIFQLGLLYMEKRDMAKAEAAFKAALNLVPNYANAHWYLASIYEAQGKTSDAVSQLEAILSSDPNNQSVKDRLNGLRSGQSNGGLLPPVDDSGPRTP